MIQTFTNKALEKLLTENISKDIPKELEKKIRIRLEVIDAAVIIDDIRLPGYDLHELKGDRKEALLNHDMNYEYGTGTSRNLR